MDVCAFSPLLYLGPDTSSLAALSYSLHKSLAEEHNGKERWQYRALTTLSVNADISDKRRKQAGAAPATALKWLDKSIVSHTSTIGTPKTTSQVHPRMMTESLIELSKGRGLEVVYGTADRLEKGASGGYKVAGVRRDGGDKFEVEVDKVVVAAGPWTGELIRKFNKSLGTPLKAGRSLSIRGSRAHSVVIRPPASAQLEAQALFTSIKTGSTSCEPEIYNRPDGTAYACGPTDDSPLPRLASDVRVDQAACDSILRQVGGLAPGFLDGTVEANQACYLPVGSGDPVIGEVAPGVVVASGHSCWGICNGPGTGLVVSEIVLDGKAKSADISELLP